MAYKFQKLKDFFSNQRNKRIVLTFKQIEEILGFKLCDSAYKHRVYWNDKSSPTHTFTKAWTEAGYEVEDYSEITKRKVTFVK